MANQITIDIVAETKKLTSGINDANSQIDGMSSKLKGAAAAAGAAASAFVLKQGVTFLKQGIDEAKEAQEVMRGATTTFGEGSAALAKITADAEKFGKEIAVDNDEIIKLSTQLGSRLPEDAKALSAELVNLGFDVEAFTGGAISAETMTNKLAKALADGELKATDLQKIVPGLTEAQYAQAEAASKAGDNQKALDIIIDAAQAKYGDAAEKNVTATQKFDKALADLKESVGTKILPIVEKFIGALTTLIEKFDGLPKPVQNVILGFAAVIGIGGPLLTFFASMKTSLITLGILKAADAAASGVQTAALGAQTTATGAATGAQRAFNLTMLANPITLVIAAIVAIIAIIILLVKNWDTVTETAKKVWEAIKEFFGKAYEFIKESIGKAIDWVKENWPLILAILTGPIGLAILAITKNFDKIKDKVGEVIAKIKDIFGDLPETMLNVGKNIVMGLWNGMQNMVGWLRDKVTGFFKNLLPSWAEKALGIASPSKVFASIGKNIIGGLQSTFNAPAVKAVSNRAQAGISVPKVSLPSLMTSKQASGINITINAGLGTNGAQLGRQVSSAIKQYGKVSTKAVAF